MCQVLPPAGLERQQPSCDLEDNSKALKPTQCRWWSGKKGEALVSGAVVGPLSQICKTALPRCFTCEFIKFSVA